MIKKENIRIKEFRQLRKEIRGSQEYLIVGIDVAKEKHRAFFGTATGKTLLRRLIFENSIDGFEKLHGRMEAIKAEHALDKVVFGLEPTANYHKPLAEYVIRCGHNVVLVSGSAVTKNRELLDGRWDKHDDKDSANIADLISQGKCLYYDYPPMALRDLLSLKRRLKKQEHGTRVRIRNHLLGQYFPEFDRNFRDKKTDVSQSHYGRGISQSRPVRPHCHLRSALTPLGLQLGSYSEFRVGEPVFWLPCLG